MEKQAPTLIVEPFEGAALFGFARRDITPPFGIYGRMWGASSHDRSEGTDKPLLVTAMAFKAEGSKQPALLVGVDAASLGDLAGREGLEIRNAVESALGIPASHLMLACSHTHSSPWAARSRAQMPGGDLIEEYLLTTKAAIISACQEAIANMSDAILTFTKGSCSLASNRDMIDPHDSSRYLTGFNPQVPADDTVMVGRVIRISDNRTIGTIVNYACHPTTLGWDNRKISPDYVGAMRELIEKATDGAPNLFLQGASGELGPAHQYVAETDVAEHHGKQLGYAALAALAGMNPPGKRMEFIRAVESGAPLGYWEPVEYSVPTQVAVAAEPTKLPTKPWPTIAELDKQLETEADSFARERIYRKRSIAALMSSGDGITLTSFGWRIGNVIFVGAQCEVYSIWQKTLRENYPDFGVVAITCVDYEAIGYVVPDELHELNLYQAWQPPFGKGVMQALLTGSRKAIDKALGGS